MKLYYAPGACSLNPHIILRESGLPFELDRIDNRAKKTEDGSDYLAVNPKGQVPALMLDDGTVLTENGVISQYIADKASGAHLAPKPGTMERYRLQEWLSFIGSEIHKSYANLFNPNAPEDIKAAARQRVAQKIAVVDKALEGKDYLLGTFSVADTYAYVIMSWAKRFGIDISNLKNVTAFLDRIAARPSVREARKVEGLD
ncbi:MAG TPA: glutathione transferase GstA [Hyphomicrobiales bacterium]|nr:glutathione transferase GstA [Hyphomicrobiales bacterium]